jgi:DNA repair photolyase
LERSFCSARKILHPSTLLDFKYEIGPYYGCEHNCHYCYINNASETDHNKTVLVHRDYAAQLAQELSAIEPQTLFIGMDTDPYQPIEEEYGHTRQTLRQMREAGFAACILTKSGMVVRDIDVLADMPGSSVGVSVAFHDEDVRKLFEEAAPSNDDRLEGLAQVKKAGIETYVLISPVMPFITDVDILIDTWAPVADTIWIYALGIEAESDLNWKNTESILRQSFPDIARQFAEAAFSPQHSYWKRLKQHLTQLQKQRGLSLRIELRTGE